eukprot:4565885-Pyramimonas_sp.AAC.1
MSECCLKIRGGSAEAMARKGCSVKLTKEVCMKKAGPAGRRARGLARPFFRYFSDKQLQPDNKHTAQKNENKSNKIIARKGAH